MEGFCHRGITPRMANLVSEVLVSMEVSLFAIKIAVIICLFQKYQLVWRKIKNYFPVNVFVWFQKYQLVWRPSFIRRKWRVSSRTFQKYQLVWRWYFSAMLQCSSVPVSEVLVSMEALICFFAFSQPYAFVSEVLVSMEVPNFLNLTLSVEIRFRSTSQYGGFLSTLNLKITLVKFQKYQLVWRLLVVSLLDLIQREKVSEVLVSIDNNFSLGANLYPTCIGGISWFRGLGFQ